MFWLNEENHNHIHFNNISSRNVIGIDFYDHLEYLVTKTSKQDHTLYYNTIRVLFDAELKMNSFS